MIVRSLGVFLLVSLAFGGASGGELAVADVGRNAYSHPLPGLAAERRRAHSTGNSFFNENWVAAPASASSRDGLGPVFNARSCSACHPLDGRGSPDSVALLVRMSVLKEGKAVADPIYGDQIHPLAIPGAQADAEVEVSWREQVQIYPDGATCVLRAPSVDVKNWREGAPSGGLLLSPRVGNAVFGLGFLEAVPAVIIAARADPADADGDGISGRVNQVPDKETGKILLGRFGWKANQPALRQQAADAFLGDIGITTPVNPVENSRAELPNGGSPELPEVLLQRVTTYLQTLAPPARRNAGEPAVQRGEKLFTEIQCAACHLPEMRTAEVTEIPELAGQIFHPYTDLLLHDLGEGLADHRPDHDASGSEWRTPPLWGLGLLQTVNGHTTLLHDGRARNVEEAILWHGGEAEPSRERFRALPVEERNALMAFLQSL